MVLDNNELEGQVPDKVCERHTDGRLERFSTDCKIDHYAKVNCSCCFNCQITGEVCPDLTFNVAVNEDETKRIERIKHKCVELSGEDVCKHNSIPNLAMRWLVEDDKLHLDVTSWDFVQRYTMLIIYFSLGPDGWANKFWLSPNEDECDIPGVTCNVAKKIVSLNFGKYNCLSVN